MKKIKVVVAVLVVGLMLAKECVIAQASEQDLAVTSRGMDVRELSQAEVEALSNEMTVEAIGGCDAALQATNSSYRVFEYSEVFDFSIEGTWVAAAETICTVWHYTDGKVHLYRRTITVTRLATIDTQHTYGRIVNTDGSLSYTEGDRVTIIDYGAFWTFAIDFRVTPTEASFNCYEV